MSGVKGRSGRKPDPVVKSYREAINKCITPAKWNKIWNAMAAAAAEGDVQAARWLHDCCYGRPRSEPEPAADTSRGPSAVYVLPARQGETLPPDAIIVQDEALLTEPESSD